MRRPTTPKPTVKPRNWRERLAELPPDRQEAVKAVVLKLLRLKRLH